MAKAKNTTISRKHVEDESSTEVPYDTEWSATPTTDTDTGLPFFRGTRANINNIVAHPKSFHWVQEFGERDVLCWEKVDIQLIAIGKIKTADLETWVSPSSLQKLTPSIEMRGKECKSCFNGRRSFSRDPGSMMAALCTETASR
jgi:hypothetical protein